MPLGLGLDVMVISEHWAGVVATAMISTQEARQPATFWMMNRASKKGSARINR